MRSFYFRWAGIFVIGALLSLAAWQRYVNEVAVTTPDRLSQSPTPSSVRVQGRIEPGTLKLDAEKSLARFDLGWNNERLPAVYTGDDLDNLREFKTIILIGHFNTQDRQFEANKMALVSNYGFITAAYLAGVIPLGFFLFYMERRVALLYDKIKEEKLYQPEKEK